jgi:hypothetical protein
MSIKFTTPATIEIELPGIVDALEYKIEEMLTRCRGSFKAKVLIELRDAKFRFRVVDKHGEKHERILTLKRLMLGELAGELLPVYDAGKEMLYTIEDVDGPLIVGPK